MGGKTGTILMQVRVPSVARDFSPSSADSLVASVQSLCAITSINVCASRSVRVLKIPNTASYTTFWTHKNTCTLIGMGSTTLGNPNFLQGTMKCFFFFNVHIFTYCGMTVTHCMSHTGVKVQAHSLSSFQRVTGFQPTASHMYK